MVIFAMLIGRAFESASAPALARPPFSATRPTDDSQEHINIGRRRIASGWSYRPARHALGIAQRALRKPRAFGVIWPRSGRTRGGARFTAFRLAGRRSS